MNFELFNPQHGAPNPSNALARYPQLADFYSHLGNTPLIPVPSPRGGAKILAKCEYENPFGSVKDRAAFGMFCDAIDRHDPDRGPLKLLDASGGNMGKALAMMCHLCDIPVHLVIPDSSPQALVDILEQHNARITKVDHQYFLLGLIAKAQEIAQQEPGWTLLSQHLNLVNVAVHQHQTGKEIRRQLHGLTANGWVAAVGTGGTLSGVYAALSEDNPQVKVQGTTPAELPFGTMAPPDGRNKFAGAGGMGFGFKQPFITRMKVLDIPFYPVSWQESLSAMFEFYKLTGMKIGSSSAANWQSAYHLAATMGPEETVITLFADAGSDADRIQGEEFFNCSRPIHTS